jgi:hypothetical protein
LAEIDLLLIRRQPLQRSLRVEWRRAEQLQALLDALGCGGVEGGG